MADTAAEGDETLTLRLSNARSSPPQELSVDLSPDEAEGTIADGPGAAEAAQAVLPLTASFEGMPEAHDGESAFRFRVAFSEPIAISFRSLREDAFQVAGGPGWTRGGPRVGQAEGPVRDHGRAGRRAAMWRSRCRRIASARSRARSAPGGRPASH